MKILQVCALGATAETLLKRQIDYFLSRGIEVEIACSPDAISHKLQNNGYIVRPVQIDRKINPVSNIKTIISLAKIMREHQYDLVHVHTPIAAFLGRVAAKLAGIKRIVYTSHGLPFHDQSTATEYFIYSNVEKVAGKFTDLIISQNHEDISTCEKLKIAPKSRLGYLGNGVDIARFNRQKLDKEEQKALRQSLSIPESAELLVGLVGRLTKKKGVDYLIEAAAKLVPQFPNLQIVIVGGEINTDPEPCYLELVAKIEELGIKNNVTFTGKRYDIPEIMGLLDIFCLPTYTHEGLPRSIVEAMAMSLPVVTTDIRGCREIVVQNQTGLIVPPFDTDSLAQALTKLLENAELRKQYGAAGRARVEAQFDENLVFERLVEFYQQLGLKV